MAELTKKDIKEVFVETLEPFAKAIQGDLSGLKTDVLEFKKETYERFNKIDSGINWIHGSLNVIQREIAEIKVKLDNIIYRHEFDQLRERISKIEKKVGI
jgi:hypothetical protein